MSGSLFVRALLALVLLVGFYVLAIGIAVALALAPLIEIALINRVHIQLALLCIVGAVLILWSLLPRIDRFEAPGPRLLPDAHPRLFEVIAEVAAQTGQAMPAEVYLVPDVNAWVAQRGGVLGIGSRRVMGLGLPLLQALSVPQVRAVLAHEFGHFDGGDTRLGPLIYRTRAAIGRTLESLASTGSGFLALVQMPFELYGKLFLRVTHAVSRAQEYAADRLAARTQGARPMIEGLRRVHAAGLAFGAYWTNEMVPVLEAGYRPPLAEGFARFLAAERLATRIDAAVAAELAEGQQDPYDTHPPLRERIAALEHLDEGGAAAEGPPATTLLSDLEALERALLPVGDLRSIAWEEVGTTVYAPQWRERAKGSAAALAGLTPTTIPATANEHAAIGLSLVGGRRDVPADVLGQIGRGVLGSALASALLDQGWQVEALPGEPVRLRFDERTVEPFGLVEERAGLDPDAWRARCEEVGIGELPLA